MKKILLAILATLALTPAADGNPEVGLRSAGIAVCAHESDRAVYTSKRHPGLTFVGAPTPDVPALIRTSARRLTRR